MLSSIKKFKVSYPYPLEYPLKVVINRLGVEGLLGWLYQRYAYGDIGKVVVTERIVEFPLAQQWIGREFPIMQGKFALEVGHVASQMALELASLGCAVQGIDLRPYPIAHKNLKNIQGDFLTHMFDTKFDLVYSLSVIEHFGYSGRYGGQDQIDNTLDEQAFKKMAELLRADGRAIVSVPFARVYCEGVWFRVYTRQEIEAKLQKEFSILESRYFVRRDNQWVPIVNMSDDPESPHDGVAVFLLAPLA